MPFHPWLKRNLYAIYDRGSLSSMKLGTASLQSCTSSSIIRVLHITASSMIGGGPEHVWQLVRHLPASTVSFIAAPSCEPYGARFVEAVGAERMYTLPQRKFSFTVLWGLIQFIRDNRIDIIHSHGKGAGVYGRIAALITQTTSVHTFHGIHLLKQGLARQVYLALERVLCRVSSACITVSGGELVKAQNLKICSKKLFCIFNGVEVPEKLSFSVQPSPFSLVHVSRFDPVQKNSLWLVDLALALRQADMLNFCRFVLVGEGEELPELQRCVRAAGLGEYFEILGSQPSARPFLCKAGCLISTSRWEGLPLAVLEAQAEGVPAVVTDVVGNRDAIADGVTGFVYPLDDATTAVARIKALIDDASLWQRMRTAAHMRAQTFFSVEKMAKEVTAVYGVVLGN